jgi:O-antigen ligase
LSSALVILSAAKDLQFRYNHKSLAMELQTQSTPVTHKHTDSGVATLLKAAIFFFFCLFVILLPWSIKGARYAWIAAFYLWIADLILERKRLHSQPLAAPMLAYIVLSGLSCVFSYEPYLSWPRMKLVCWTALIGTLFAQSLRRLSQVRTLLVLLLLSATAVGGFTAWQYLRGIGVQVIGMNPNAPLYGAGIRPNDILYAVNNHPVQSTRDLSQSVSGLPPDTTVRVKFLRGSPVRKKETFAPAADFSPAKLGMPEMVLQIAKPYRAAGTLGHYGKLAEVFAPIGCLAWALMLGAPPRRYLWRASLAIMFVAITATVFATQSRAALSGLLAGCGIALFLMVPRKTRIWLVAALLLLAIAAGIWVQHTRGLKWVDLRDPGTQYRLLMWRDGARLALRHPFFGVGMESVQNRWPEWNLQGFAQFQKFWNFHSDLVQLAAERGLLTLAAWLWFVVAYLIYLWRLVPRMQQRTRFGWAVATGVLASFVAFLFSSLVESSLGDDTLVMLLFFCFGVAVAMERMLGERGAVDVA